MTGISTKSGRTPFGVARLPHDVDTKGCLRQRAFCSADQAIAGVRHGLQPDLMLPKSEEEIGALVRRGPTEPELRATSTGSVEAARIEAPRPERTRAEGNMANPVLVEVTRGAVVESRHRGALSVFDADGKTVWEIGDTDRPVFPRSALKAIQALPLVESGAADAYGFGDRELALACASHSGDPAHVELATAMLAKAGLDREALECGARWPSSHYATRARSRRRCAECLAQQLLRQALRFPLHLRAFRHCASGLRQSWPRLAGDGARRHAIRDGSRA